MNDHEENAVCENRIQYLEGKTELTEDDIVNVIEFHHEYPEMSSLKKYTDKKYRDLTQDEKETLINSLLHDEEYLRYKNCYIAKSKLLYDSSETLIKETAAVSRLSDLGYEVYLLPYAYARDNMNFFQKSADSITAGDFLEMKSVVSTGEKAGYSTYKDARQQADNIYLSFVNDVSEKKAISNIYRAIGGIREGNRKKGRENNFAGYVFLNFEKTNEFALYKISKDGFATKIGKEDFEQLKKIWGTAYDSSPVEENPMTEHGSSPISTIPQSAEKSTVTDNSEVLTKPMTITVNDKERTCRNGVLEGFKNAVKMVDELLDENKLLREENAELHKKLEQKSHKKDRADGWER